MKMYEFNYNLTEKLSFSKIMLCVNGIVLLLLLYNLRPVPLRFFLYILYT